MRKYAAGVVAFVIAFAVTYALGSGISTSLIFSLILGVSVPSFSLYMKRLKTKGVEARLPDFLLDTASSINSGMSLPIAIKSVSTHDYGPLSPFVKRMAMQIDWGVPFQKMLSAFSSEVGSRTVNIAMNTIIEANKSGGNIAEVLKATASGVSEIERLKKERSSRIYSQLVNGYIIFFVFLGVMIMLQGNIFPSISANSTRNPFFFYDTFRNLIMIQGFFSGIAIGKMSEGTVTAGFKHSAILVAVGFLAFTILVKVPSLL